MILKGVIFEDFVNYKKPCMTLEFPYCSFKCDKECGKPVCQNGTLVNTPNIETDVNSLIERYLSNPITQAICAQGLEPMDSLEELLKFISTFRQKSKDDIIIYTGYTKEEIHPDVMCLLSTFDNIIMKFGRYIPDQQSHFDEVLGVHLASDNQYAEKIS